MTDCEDFYKAVLNDILSEQKGEVLQGLEITKWVKRSFLVIPCKHREAGVFLSQEAVPWFRACLEAGREEKQVGRLLWEIYTGLGSRLGTVTDSFSAQIMTEKEQERSLV